MAERQPSLVTDSPLFGLSQRLPPSNIQAEQALLGGILANNRAYERVTDFLRPEHFSHPIHARLYQRIEERILDGKLADAVTLKGDFQFSGVLDEAGGVGYLAELLTAMIGIINVGEYGRAIHDCYIRRQLIDVGESIVNGAFGEDVSIDGVEQIEAAEAMLSSIRTGDARRDRLMSMSQAVSAAIRMSEEAYRLGSSPAILTGLEPLDKATGGFWPGDFNLLGGVPGAGKTAIAVQIATMIGERLRATAMAQGMTAEQAEHQPGVAIFELEMAAEELGARVAAARAGVSVQRLRTGDLDIKLAETLMFVERGICGMPVRVHDCRATSMKLLAAKVRMHLRRQPEKLIIIDHLLVADSEEDRSGRTSERNAASVSKAARTLKALAGELKLPFLVLTHIGRAAGKRDNPRPMQSDLKYAGEGDADNIWFVHRPSMFMEGERPKRWARESDEKFAKRMLTWEIDRSNAEHLAELIVAKARMGPTGIHPLYWDGPTNAFSPWRAS